MKNILVVLMMSIFLFSCTDDGIEVFNVETDKNTFAFTEVPGGAEMAFNLVKGHEDVFEIEVEYTNHWEQKIRKTAYYLTGKIVLDGFVNAETDVPVTIYLKNNRESKSLPIDTVFSTEPLEANSLLVAENNITAKSSWGGFSLKVTDTFGATDGTIYVGYRGIDPLDNKEKDLVIKSLPISEATSLGVIDVTGNAVFNSEGQGTAVVWVENEFKQLVGRSEYNVEFLQTELLASDGIVMQDASIEKSIENGDNYGWKYLFDGDTKGQKTLETSRIHSFLSKDNMRKEEWIFDLGGEYVLVQIRLYSAYWASVSYPSPWFVAYRGSNVTYNNGQSLISKLPSDFEIWGQTASSTEWVKLGTYNSPRGRLTVTEETWCADAVGYAYFSDLDKYPPYAERTGSTTPTDIADKDPIYALLSLDVDENEVKYKYIKLKVLDTFVTGALAGYDDDEDYDSSRSAEVYDYDLSKWVTVGNQVAFSELEIYIKK